MNKTSGIMICVTGQKTCERLINTGRDISVRNGAEIHVVHVARQGQKYLGSKDEAEALEYLFQVSKKANARMSVLRAKHVIDTLVDYARKQEIGIIILGEPRVEEGDSGIINELKQKLPGVECVVVPS